MSLGARFLLGVVPAVLLFFLALVGSVVFGPMLLLSACLGMYGLIWSFVGYSRKTAAVVLLLLLIGVCCALAGAYVGPITIFLRDVRNDQLARLPWVGFRVLFLSWLFFGPALVGLMQARGVIEVLWKRSPHYEGTAKGPLVP